MRLKLDANFCDLLSSWPTFALLKELRTKNHENK